MNLPLEAKDVKGFVHDLHLLLVVDGVDLDLAKAAGGVVVDVVGELAELVEVDNVGDQEVEDVVTSLAPDILMSKPALSKLMLMTYGDW